MGYFALLACLLLAAEKTDKEKIQGGWFLHEFTRDGGQNESYTGTTPTYEFKGDKLIIDGDDAGSTYKIDPSKKPAWIDITIGPSYKEPGLRKGIYKIEGDILTICERRKGEPRPTEFTAKKELKHELSVFKRKPKLPKLSPVLPPGQVPN